MSSTEPGRVSPGGALSARMSTLARRDTAPEMQLRRELHHRGLRYRTQMKVPGNPRRTIDIAFTRARLAVFVDGCFWHGCPEHGVHPVINEQWWIWKIRGNQDRDSDTDRILTEQDWRVIRVWEHEPVAAAASRVESAWRQEVGHARGRPALTLQLWHA